RSTLYLHDALPISLLLRMPVLVGDPARGLGTEQDRRHALGRAGEDAVAAAEMAVEFGLVDVDRGLVEPARLRDPVDREAAQALALVVPGIEVPVVARSEEHTSELQSRENLVCRLLLEKKK